MGNTNYAHLKRSMKDKSLEASSFTLNAKVYHITSEMFKNDSYLEVTTEDDKVTKVVFVEGLLGPRFRLLEKTDPELVSWACREVSNLIEKDNTLF